MVQIENSSNQKFDKSYDIMSLRKPYKGKKPTALFISKYPILSKKGNQEVYSYILSIEEKKKVDLLHFFLNKEEGKHARSKKYDITYITRTFACG